MFKASVLLACLVAIAATASVQTGTSTKVEGDKEFLTKQKEVLQLLQHIHQPLLVPELVEKVTKYDLEKNISSFNDVEVVKQFLKVYKAGEFVNHKQVFTPLYKGHVRQARLLFEVLYNAKDWETFITTAAWCREHLNNGLFIYSYYVTILHRPDTKGLVLPPIYEVCPHLFVHQETIQKAYNARMKVSSRYDSKESFVIPTNYTGFYKTNNPELRTSYFTEDIGLNFYHLMHHLTYPHWLRKEHYGFKNERQGELFAYVHQQILTRYRLERLANNMYEMKNFSYSQPNIVAYNPSLEYMNGQPLPHRPAFDTLFDTDSTDVDRVKDFERRVRAAIDSGYVKDLKGEKIPITAENGLEILGHLIQKTTDSVNPKYYGPLYQLTLNLVAHVVDPYHQNNVAPGTLQQFHTMLRDPMYYRIYQHINQIFESYQKDLPVYTQEQLTFPGITVEGVSVDKLMTYFDTFDVEITNAVTVGKIEDDRTLKIVARQPRLNHKEFSYRINVNSNQDVSGMVRVFLAPKYDVTGTRTLGLAEQKKYMLQIDRFPYDIKNGKTVIERNSKDSTVTVEDPISFRLLCKQVEDALQGNSKFYINEERTHYGFPNRLILPKGKKSGMSYTMIVVITPYQTKTTEEARGVRTFVTCGGNNICGDTMPLGFPFDRRIIETDYRVPNIYTTDVTIYHKKTEEYSMEV